MFQNRDETLIREPGNRTYSSPEPVSVTAKELWEYAVLSENVYEDSKPQRPEPTPEAYRKVCTTVCIPMKLGSRRGSNLYS